MPCYTGHGLGMAFEILHQMTIVAVPEVDLGVFRTTDHEPLLVVDALIQFVVAQESLSGNAATTTASKARTDHEPALLVARILALDLSLPQVPHVHLSMHGQMR